MKKIHISIFNLAAFICGNILGVVYSYRTQQRVRLFWNRVFSYSVSKRFKQFGKGVSVANDVVLLNPRYITVGNYSSIGDRTVLTAWDRYEGDRFTPSISIGSNTNIGADCHITAIRQIVIGDGVLLGKKITITDNAHGACMADQLEIAPIKRRLVSKGGVTIEDHVWIGDKATILPGVHIGRGAIVAANAVVSHDVPAGCVVAGVPAKVVKEMR